MRDYSIGLQKDFSKEEKTVIRKTPIVVILLIFFFGILFFWQRKNNTSPLNATPTAKTNLKINHPEDLLVDLEKLTAKNPGTYSIYIYDLTSMKGFGINEQMVITAASVNKFPILASLYYLAGRKDLDLEKTVTIQQKDIQDYGSGIIRYDPPGSVYSLKTLARLMMEKSDNTAAYILSNLILTQDQIQELVDSWGLSQTDIVNNKTSVKDMSILLTKMYRGKITNKALTAEMLDFSDKSDYDDRIPKGIPGEIKVYHKTGDEVGKIHDIGIIDMPNKPYYLGIMSTDTTNEAKTKEILAEISKKVYTFMNGL